MTIKTERIEAAELLEYYAGLLRDDQTTSDDFEYIYDGSIDLNQLVWDAVGGDDNDD